MGNLPAFLPNVKETLILKQRRFRIRQSLRMFPVIVSNNYLRMIGKIRFTIEDKSLIIIRY
jgi:hypothetical protein